MTKYPVTELPPVRVFSYRGVSFSFRTPYNEWMTAAVIKIDGRQTKLRAKTQPALLRLIDKHIEGGGEVGV